MPAIANLYARLRDAFSSAVLGTTSTVAPALTGGLSVKARATITFIALAIAAALALAFRPLAGPFAAVTFFPALMVGALFGGYQLAAAAFVLAVALTALFFMAPAGTALFALGLVLQTGLALGLRELFRESRRWGVRYRTLIDAVSAGIIVSDRMGQIERPQPEFERATGLAWPSYAGMGWLAAVHPEDLKLTGGEPAPSGGPMRRTIRLRNANTGEWRWYQFRSVPVAGRDGRPVELISVL
ncbi:MAG: PAS domain-containing protein, partial [Alphaproteobacteria bacterium]|nr:PAS domain-containing protein [Alphaproteobacteria bacterium]